MSEKRKKLPSYTSPKGTFRYPKLAEPDFGTEKYPKPAGEFSTQQLWMADSPEAQKMIKLLTPHFEEAKALAEEQFKSISVAARKKMEKDGIKGPKMVDFYAPVYDKETEEETGEIAFKYKMKASGTYKKGKKAGQEWKRQPLVYDAKGKLFPTKDKKGKPIKLPDIWGGTVGRVSFEVAPYFVEGKAEAGISLYLTAVQVIDLVSGGARSASEYGFDEEEGYEYSPDDAQDDPTFGADSSDDDDADVDAGNF
jgi:hypothetical protein